MPSKHDKGIPFSGHSSGGDDFDINDEILKPKKMKAFDIFSKKK